VEEPVVTGSVRDRGPSVATPGPRSRFAPKNAVLLGPALLVLSIFFLAPLALIAIRSVSEPAGVALGNYIRFVGDTGYVRFFLGTFRTAFITAAACLLLGYPYAYLMNASRGRIANLLFLAVLVPLWASALVRTFAWQVVLNDTGIINSTLMALGLIHEPLALIRTPLGVIIGMTQVLLPFMVLILYAVMRKVDMDLPAAAASLGAPPHMAFWRVFFPLTLPGVAGGSLIVYVMGLGFFITPALLGGPTDQMLSQVIVTQVSQRLDWGYGAAMAMLLLVATLVVLLIAARFVRLPSVFGYEEQ
jgi:putative spermidine/putrescine transport system permease protein